MSETEQYLEQLSLLIHLWQEDGGAAPIWRASVRHVTDGRRIGFASPEQALQYLAGEIQAFRYSRKDRTEPETLASGEGQTINKP